MAKAGICSKKSLPGKIRVISGSNQLPGRMTFHTFLNWVLLLIVGYVILALLLYLFQSRLLYHPAVSSRALEATPAQAGLPFESVTLTTGDNIAIEGWYLPVPKNRGTLLFFHGNAGNISHRLESLRQFHSLDLAILIVDYRGYGRSQGHPTETGTYLDAQAAWHYLTTQRKIPAREIIIFGRSMGGAIAAQLAAHAQPGALIVESTFTSIPDLAAELYPFIPARWLSRFQYNTRRFLQAVACPVLIIHSRDDELIPFAHGQALFEAAHPPKQFLALNGDHNNGYLVNSRVYLEGIDAFLKNHLNPQ